MEYSISNCDAMDVVRSRNDDDVYEMIDNDSSISNSNSNSNNRNHMKVCSSFVQNVPTDTLDCICSFLLLEDLGSFTATSKRMYHLLKESCSSLYMSDSSGFISSKGLKSLLQRYHQLNILHLDGLASVGDCLFDILNQSQSSTTLKEISLRGCHLSYWCRSALNLQNLTSLKIAGGSIRVPIGTFLLGGNTAIAADDHDHDNNHTDDNNNNNNNNNNKTSRLRELMIGQCSSLQDIHLTNLVNSNLQQQLESLTLLQCLRVKRPSLTFHNLRSLSLMACYSLEDLPNFHCPSLIDLKLTFCSRLPGQVIQDIVHRTAPNLRSLTLTKCLLLRKLEVYSESLETLKIGLNNPMENVVVFCDRLQVLETTCTRITSLHIVSSRLPYLNLCSMTSLEELRLHCLSLQQLGLAGCENLTNENCHIHCPALREVDVCGTNLDIEQIIVVDASGGSSSILCDDHNDPLFVRQCSQTAPVSTL